MIQCKNGEKFHRQAQKILKLFPRPGYKTHYDISLSVEIFCNQLAHLHWQRKKEMSQKKKKVRSDFRNAVFTRDGFKCKFCNETEDLDAHHITDRNEMPNGGYCAENGISLCKAHHELAEVFHSTGTAAPGYSPEDLYKTIGSDLEKAFKASEKLA